MNLHTKCPGLFKKGNPGLTSAMENENAETSKYVEYDDIYTHVKSFGSYQKKVAYGSCVMLIGQGLQFAHLVFVTATPKFKCSTPNVTCGGINKCCTNCTSYEFDSLFTTIVSEWNLICDRSHLAAIVQAMFFVGMLVGSFVSGILSDAFGRKPVIFGAIGIMAICGICQSFVKTSIPLFAFLRFGSGAFIISTTLSHFILMLEVIGPGFRARMGNVNGFYWNTSDLIKILIAYYIREWRTFVWVTSVPPFLLYLFWRVFPESPRWLVLKGKLDRAHQVIIKYGGKDNKPCDPEQLKNILETIHDDQVKRTSNAKRHTPLDLLRTPKLRRWTIILCFGWFTVSMIHFALMINTTLLPGNVYVISVFFPVLSAAVTPITWYSMNTLGRRLTHCCFMTAIGVLLLLILVIPKEYEIAITCLAVLGYPITNMEWSSVYLITTELFPTSLRNTAQGVGSAVARVGGIAAPFLLMLAQLPGLSIVLPMTIFGACAVLCGIMSLWLPETALRPLYQTAVEAEEAQEDYKIPFLKKKAAKDDEKKLVEKENLVAEDHETQDVVSRESTTC